MKKKWITPIIIAAVLIMLVAWCASAYNSLVTQEEVVNTAWSNVENQYQRRSDLLVTVEKYPDLKANENFKELQAQLEGTENRISVERRKFNEAARGFNTTIRHFPKNIIAGMFGFEKHPYFEAEEGSEKAPEVKF